jgi:hypothetical protein
VVLLIVKALIFFFYHGAAALVGQGLLIVVDSWSHSVRHTTLARTPLVEWPARHRDLYLTAYTIHNRQTSILPAGFKPTIPASERLQTHALDCVATGIGNSMVYFTLNMSMWSCPHACLGGMWSSGVTAILIVYLCIKWSGIPNVLVEWVPCHHTMVCS